MRRSILDIVLVKKNITPFRISIALSPAPTGLQPFGASLGTQAKAWAKFPRPFGPTRPHADTPTRPHAHTPTRPTTCPP